MSLRSAGTSDVRPASGSPEACEAGGDTRALPRSLRNRSAERGTNGFLQLSPGWRLPARGERSHARQLHGRRSHHQKAPCDFFTTRLSISKSSYFFPAAKASPVEARGKSSLTLGRKCTWDCEQSACTGDGCTIILPEAAGSGGQRRRQTSLPPSDHLRSC